jgi:hypothetical protein
MMHWMGWWFDGGNVCCPEAGEMNVILALGSASPCRLVLYRGGDFRDNSIPADTRLL